MYRMFGYDEMLSQLNGLSLDNKQNRDMRMLFRVLKSLICSQNTFVCGTVSAAGRYFVLQDQYKGFTKFFLFSEHRRPCDFLIQGQDIRLKEALMLASKKTIYTVSSPNLCL